MLGPTGVKREGVGWELRAGKKKTVDMGGYAWTEKMIIILYLHCLWPLEPEIHLRNP